MPVLRHTVLPIAIRKLELEKVPIQLPSGILTSPGNYLVSMRGTLVFNGLNEPRTEILELKKLNLRPWKRNLKCDWRLVTCHTITYDAYPSPWTQLFQKVFSSGVTPLHLNHSFATKVHYLCKQKGWGWVSTKHKNSFCSMVFKFQCFNLVILLYVQKQIQDLVKHLR